MKLNQLNKKYPNTQQKDIILLLEEILDTTYSKLVLSGDIKLTESQEEELSSYIHRLQNNEPIQYIIGTWDFIDLQLKVDNRALIPRPETEILAQEGVSLANQFESPKVLDIGCGSGCIGLYIKHAVPNASVTLCDISEKALSLAKENSKNLDLDVNFIHSDMRDIVGEYDIIISNPPYINKEYMDELDTSVKDFEPENALFGGDDGLEFYKVFSVIHNNLTNCGYLAVEIGVNQSEAVSNLFEVNFEDIKVIDDFANIPRVIVAKKR